MSDQLYQRHPTDPFAACQVFKPHRKWYRFGLSLGLAVFGLGRLSHQPTWAFPANRSAETGANTLSKSRLAQKQQGWSISQQMFRQSSPGLSQPQTPSLATAVSGRTKLPPKTPSVPWRGEFRLDDFDVDPEPPTETPVVGDPELGILRLKEQPLPIQRQPVVYLLGRVDFLSSDNIFLETDPVNDQFVRTGLSLVAVPSLGPQTSLLAAVGGVLLRYRRFTDAGYNDLKFQVGVSQRLFPQTYGQLSWSNQQLFEAGGGERFFNDHSVQLGLGRRDRLHSRLMLDTFYQLRFSFSDPNDFSRFIQTLGISLSHDIAPELRIALNYQLTLADFTQQARYDTFNQLFGEITFNLTSESRFNLFGGFSFGDSSGDTVDFDDTILGLSLDIDLPLF